MPRGGGEVPLDFAIWPSSWSKTATICEGDVLGTTGPWIYANHSRLPLRQGKDRQTQTETDRDREPKVSGL